MVLSAGEIAEPWTAAGTYARQRLLEFEGQSQHYPRSAEQLDRAVPTESKAQLGRMLQYGDHFQGFEQIRETLRRGTR